MPKMYRIRKTRGGRPAPGVGLRLMKALGMHPLDDALTSASSIDKIADGTVVINYGRSVYPIWGDLVEFINHPDAVAKCVDKRVTLKELARTVPVLYHTEDQKEAQAWCDEGFDIYVRHKPMGKKGNGIEIVKAGDPVPQAPLYTCGYISHTEFRVHVVNGRAIDVVQKRRVGKKRRERLGIKIEEGIRNHRRGWVFCHNGFEYPEKMVEDCVKAVRHLGMDFAGVDVLARTDNEKFDGKVVDYVICEVNSAPGMSSPTTFKAYVEAFKEVN
jgi:hypothetical protein